MRYKTGFALSVLMMGILLGANAQGADIQKLFSDKVMERREAYNEIIRSENAINRDEVVSALIENLAKEDIDRCFEGPLHFTIKALGELKAVTAIPFMLPFFTYVPDNYRIEETIPTQYYYPTARAFIRFGEVVVPIMESKICDNTESDEGKELAAWVIKEILGKETSIERLRVLEEKNTFARKSSGRLSEYIENFKWTFHHPKHHSK